LRETTDYKFLAKYRKEETQRTQIKSVNYFLWFMKDAKKNNIIFKTLFYMEKVYFITGIDTGCGKTVVTGLLARHLYSRTCKVITFKPVQTGCRHWSNDIETHRNIMEDEYYDEDLQHITCPYILKYPSSPHLAAKKEKVVIDKDFITKNIDILKKKYDVILIEGAGGIMVPWTNDYLQIDYIQENNFPVILVTHSKLGSINHTLLTLEICKQRNIEVKAVIYNNFIQNEELDIINDSREFFIQYLKKNFEKTHFFEIPFLKNIRTSVKFDFEL